MVQQTRSGFQTIVNIQPGVGQAGDFADANIRSVVLAGPGGFVAADIPRGPIVGHFAWGNQTGAAGAAEEVSGITGVTEGQLAFSNYQGELTAEIGFVGRHGVNPIIVKYLDQTSEYVSPGLIVSLFNTGGFWALFAAGATPGQKVFAKYLDGEPVAGTAGASTVTQTFTGVLANTGILTTSAVTGVMHVGDVDLVNGYSILDQLSGTAGGAGTYLTSLVGTAIGSVAMTVNDRIETAYYVDSPADAGELAKITTWG